MKLFITKVPGKTLNYSELYSLTINYIRSFPKKAIDRFTEQKAAAHGIHVCKDVVRSQNILLGLQVIRNSSIKKGKSVFEANYTLKSMY